MKIFVEIVGWSGSILILLAYILLSRGLIQGRSKTYQWMNFFGAIGFVINGLYNGAMPSAVLNIVWLVIAAWTILTLTRTKPATPPTP